NRGERMLGAHEAFRRSTSSTHAVLERACGLSAAECDGRSQLQPDYGPSIPECEGDKEQLIQAFLNIARNAMQALLHQESQNDNRITLRTRALRQVTIGHRRHRLALRVDVIDNGPGVPDSLLKSVFYPMISGRPEGSG